MTKHHQRAESEDNEQPRRIHQNRRNFFDTEKRPKEVTHGFNPPYDERLDIHMEEFIKYR
jgi:hypothetical protein